MYTKSCSLWAETFSVTVKHLKVSLILEKVDSFDVGFGISVSKRGNISK